MKTATAFLLTVLILAAIFGLFVAIAVYPIIANVFMGLTIMFVAGYALFTIIRDRLPGGR